jgi:hypothetical protein
MFHVPVLRKKRSILMPLTASAAIRPQLEALDGSTTPPV